MQRNLSFPEWKSRDTHLEFRNVKYLNSKCRRAPLRLLSRFPTISSLVECSVHVMWVVRVWFVAFEWKHTMSWKGVFSCRETHLHHGGEDFAESALGHAYLKRSFTCEIWKSTENVKDRNLFGSGISEVYFFTFDFHNLQRVGLSAPTQKPSHSKYFVWNFSSSECRVLK